RADGVGGVIGTGDEWPAAHVAGIRSRRAMEDQVVIEPAFGAQPPSHDAVEHHPIGNIDVDHRIDVITFQKKGRLVPAARKAVENEAVVPVVLIKASLDHFLDDLIGNEGARGGQATDSRSQFRVALNVPTKNVAGADMNEVEVPGKQFRLRS